MGGWFARSNRGIEGSYLTVGFKEDVQQLMLQLSRKGKFNLWSLLALKELFSLFE